MTDTFKRAAFKTDRTLEFFSESELTTQIGYRPGLWPLVLTKELLDNAIDNCETAGIGQIEIAVQLDKHSITVSDNGTGIPDKVIRGVLDYHVRVSDKKHYIAPTRGQLGNALKCVVAAPFVATEKDSLIEVTTRGRRYSIHVKLDRIAQKPLIICTKKPVQNGTGTTVRIHWREIASYFEAGYSSEFYQFSNFHDALAALIEDYRAFNPHVNFTFNQERFATLFPDWQKWKTDAPTSPHWYRAEDLRNLIAAHINEHDLLVRDFVSNFTGLSGTKVRAAVLAQAKMERAHLSDFIRSGDVDMKAVGRLLEAMKEHSKPVQPNRLGVIGQEHLQRYFESLGASQFKYHKKTFVDSDGLPVVLEIAFAVKRDAASRGRRIFGLNWSPVFKVPSGEIDEALAEAQIQSSDPVILLFHLVRPRFEFTDHAKSEIAI